MAEKIISPGVFTDEIDQTFLPTAVTEIGAAVVGPTVSGPALIPTVVNSYSEFQAIFGDTFKSGSTGQNMAYLTSLTAKEYLKNANTLTVVRILDGEYGGASSYVITGSGANGATYRTGSAVDAGESLKTEWNEAGSVMTLHTLADGMLQDNTTRDNGGANTNLGTQGIITDSGSKHNIRWEVTAVNPDKGTFNLIIRRGDDTHNRKHILETFNNVSMDPTQNNYVARAIGDSYRSIAGTETEPYITWTGDYPPKSKYVRVEVLRKTPNYLDENGNIDSSNKATFTGSLPGINSGSFEGGSNGFAGFDSLGFLSGSAAATNYVFNEDIGDKSQGFDPMVASQGKTAYTKALNLLSNQDEYDFNLLMLPGILQSEHETIYSKAIDVCEDRGDCFVIVDPVAHGQTVALANTEANDYDSNYAAMYWPWIQVPDNELGRNIWVPPSTVMGGIFAFNDRVAHPWFAPAGLNRGGIDIAIQAEKKLTQSDRDDLYDANVNPIATFPGQGVTVFGQKTLQKKNTALDRINVRRLLIRVKKFIASASRFLVFEQNTATTRRAFLNIVNPFMEQVQSQSGVSAFRVVMDSTNNTPDTIDRNILYGQIFVQPTRTAEFVVLDFTVQPTGATFPE